MKRALLFLVCLGAGALLLVWQAGGLEGPRAHMPQPEVGTAAPAPAGGSTAFTPAGPGMPIRVKTMGACFYSRPEARVFRDPRTGETVEIPHFVSWTFEADSGVPLPGKEAPEGAVVFEDVKVHAYRGPTTLEEARRLRADPRAIDGFQRLGLYAQHARADGIATLMRAQGGATPEVRDWTIRLYGDVRIRDIAEELEMRGPALTFDPEAGRAEGEGPFVVEHAAWTLEGESLTLVRDMRLRELYHVDVYRVDVGRNVLVELRGFPEDEEAGGTAAFKPARVFADRASLLRDETGGQRVHIALEGNVRALQRGGRRLLADRLRLTAEPGAQTDPAAARRWDVSDLDAEGAPVVVEVADLPGSKGDLADARFSARRLRYERSSDQQLTTVLEGDPVILIEGDLALPGMPGGGRWIRASARDRAVMAPWMIPAHGAGAPTPGKHLLLKGGARLERRGESGGAFYDVLEGDEITLTLKHIPLTPEPGAANASEEQPVAFAALGHVKLSGTRLDGDAERLVVEGLDTLEPTLVIEGENTRMAMVGLDGGQRLPGQDPPPDLTPEATGAHGDPASRHPETAWMLDRLEASGNVAGETHLGGPLLGVPAWLEAERTQYDRVTDRLTLTGVAATPASVRVEAGPDQRHALTAPTIWFERARGMVRAEGGAEGEVWIADAGPSSLQAGLGLRPGDAHRASRLTLITDGRIEIRFRLAKVGGDPALGVPQVLRVSSPFTADVRSDLPDLVDRVRADRLEAAFVALPKEPRADKSSSVARVAPTHRPSSASAHPEPAAPRAAPERWRLTAKTLGFSLEGGRLDTFEADGGVVVTGKQLHIEGGSLRFDGLHRSLFVQGVPRVNARFGEHGESMMAAGAIRVMLAEDGQGPRQVIASRRGVHPVTGKEVQQSVEAVMVQALADRPGASERFEVDCQGDIRITRTELTTVGDAETWLKRTERKSPTAPWEPPVEIWSRRVLVRGTGLLEQGPRPTDKKTPGAADGKRHIDTVVAEGPDTALVAVTHEGKIEMWCQKIQLEVAQGIAILEGVPGRDVRLRRDGIESELVRAEFDFRTFAVRNVEAGGFILRQGAR